MLHSTKTLHILGNLTEINFKSPKNVLEILNANDISINQSCAGNGVCTTCRFFIRKSSESFSERSELEIERAEERGFLTNERLACQTEISESAEIEIPT